MRVHVFIYLYVHYTTSIHARTTYVCKYIEIYIDTYMYIYIYVVLKS